VVFLDTDVVTEHFGSHFVLGLSGAVLSGFDFAKASFWRAMGRVKKFVAQPLFSVIQHPVVSELRNMAYPLSGEVAGTLEFFNSVHFWQMYGVETGINVDSLMMNFRVADVNLGLYDHEHHGDLNIQKMSFGIMRTFLTQLESYGVIEFKDGAEISSNFKASRIDEQGNREKLDFDLSELKYEPLKKIL
jgi:glucosyl-3-phosphoglycerate synthase